MLIPVALLFLLLSGILVFLSFFKRSRIVLLVLNLFWWLLALLSAFFTGQAWMERSYSENWALYGFLLFSVPIILIVSMLTILVIVLARIRQIDNMRRLQISFYLLLFFLGVQAIVGFLMV